MSSRRLRRLDLPKEILERLTKHNITSCRDVLSRSLLEMLKLTGCGVYTVTDIFNKCSQAACPQKVTALDLWKERRQNKTTFLPTSLLDLDKVLHGGLSSATITEIAGPAGCGKTQFSIMLSVMAALPTELGGLGGAVIYIDTEGAFSAERLVEVARSKFPEHFSTDDAIVSLASQVYVDVPQSCAALLKRLQSLEEDIISKKVKLVIIDSIASLVRKEFSTTIGRNLTERTNFLSQEAAILKYVAETFSIPIVVTNQITTRFGRPESVADVQDEGVSVEGEGGYVTAALGNTWSHSVNTRLILQYLHGDTRQVLVAKSPVAPFTTFTFTIQDQGLVQQDNGAGHYQGTDPSLQHIRVRSSLPIHPSQV